MKKKIVWESYHIDEMEENPSRVEDRFDDDDDDGVGDISGHSIEKILSTPFGLYKVDDKSNPMRQFELRIGHSNFDITEEIFDTIEEIEGVEAIISISRYRFLIAVGKLFSFMNVRRDIENAICDGLGSEIDDILDKEIDRVSAEGSLWVVYLLPNGKIESFVTDDENAYEEQLKVFKEAEKLSHGILVECEDF